jgi:hypothetical protein
MDDQTDVVHVRLPRDVIARLDERRAVEVRSRSNQAQILIVEGLRRRESVDADAEVR